MTANAQRVFDESSIGEQQRARIVTIWQECCKALQKVVEDQKITQDELKFAGQFFNRLGQSGMFPNLLAVGLSMTSMRVTEGKGVRREILKARITKRTRPSGTMAYYTRGEPARSPLYRFIRGRYRQRDA